MNKKDLVKNISSEIQEIHSLTNRIENSKNIHSIDIDLALSKVRNLYELLLKLNSSSSDIIENQKEEISTIVEKQDKESKLKEEPKLEEEKQDEKNSSVESEELKNDNRIHEPEFIIETASKEEVKTEEEDHEPIEEEKYEKQNSHSPEIVADKFQSKKFIHDDIAKKNIKKDVSTKMQSKPINDINSAIGLNDKFIFIRELFENNKEQYHETIQILNNFDSFENAVSFLDENFEWDSDNGHYERLKELVRRKFASK